jgi:hypothetical protein
MEFVPPTEAEIEAVLNLRNKLNSEITEQSYNFTDTALLRFYRGRKNDFDKAFRALVRHLEWRKEFNVDNISIENYASEFNSGKICIEGFDKNQRPCVRIYASKHNKNQRDLEGIRYLIIHTLENLIKVSKPEEERIVLCFDLSNFTLQCMDYEVVQLLINILRFNYPETLSVAFIIDSPMLFSACWSMIRPWLDPVTAKKALFVSNSKLLHYMDGSTSSSKSNCSNSSKSSFFE